MELTYFLRGQGSLCKRHSEIVELSASLQRVNQFIGLESNVN